jgi:hypothetical protein
VKVLVATLCQETADIPAWWLSHACGRLAKEAHRVFLPTLGEIRATALRFIRLDRQHREWEARGRTTPEPTFELAAYNPHGTPPVREDRELAYAWAHELERKALAAGLVVELQRVRVPAVEAGRDVPRGMTADPGPGAFVDPGASCSVDDVEDMP